MISNVMKYESAYYNFCLPASAARCVTDAARLAVLRRRKSDSDDCCTKCRPGPKMFGY